MNENIKVCLLTGASGTLGNAICKSMSKNYKIVAIFRSKLPQLPDLSLNLEEEWKAGKIYCVKSDLLQETELTRIVKLTLLHFKRVDLLINAAAHSVWSSVFSDRLLNSAQNQFYLNAIVPLKLSVLLANFFWKKDVFENEKQNRNVINISSSAGINIYPGSGQSVYSASKCALNQLSKHMAEEFKAIQIRINAIAPNSFPRIIKTERVIESINHFNESRLNGKIHLIDYGKDGYL